MNKQDVKVYIVRDKDGIEMYKAIYSLKPNGNRQVQMFYETGHKLLKVIDNHNEIHIKGVSTKLAFHEAEALKIAFEILWNKTSDEWCDYTIFEETPLQ